MLFFCEFVSLMMLTDKNIDIRICSNPIFADNFVENNCVSKGNLTITEFTMSVGLSSSCWDDLFKKA